MDENHFGPHLPVFLGGSGEFDENWPAGPRILFIGPHAVTVARAISDAAPHRDWQLLMARDAGEAVHLLDERGLDALVADLRQVEDDGLELMERARVRFPDTQRILLCDELDAELALRAARCAHQFLAYPCSSELLAQRLDRSLAVRSRLTSAELRQVLLQIRHLPSMPATYREIVNRLESSSCSMQAIGELIERDAALSAKVLQMVNSSMFGATGEVSSPSVAVSLLGTEVVKAIVLSVELFSQLRTEHAYYGRAERLLRHCISTSRMAKLVGQQGAAPASARDDCFIAGLLHEVGQLVLIAEMSLEYKAVLRVAEMENLGTIAAEVKVFGVTHAELGAYLLASWGLPYAVVEAILWHHTPSLSPVTERGPLAALHIADSVSTCLEPHRAKDCIMPDTLFLRRCGLLEQAPALRQACLQM